MEEDRDDEDVVWDGESHINKLWVMENENRYQKYLLLNGNDSIYRN